MPKHVKPVSPRQVRTTKKIASDSYLPGNAKDPGFVTSELPALNAEQEEIYRWIKTIKFRRQTFGGVSEADVWKQIQELNQRYDAALRAERARYDALIAQQMGKSGRASGSGRHYG